MSRCIIEEDKTNYVLKNAWNVRQNTVANISQLPFYQYIPFTTVDRLVFKLLHLPINYQWVAIDEIVVPNMKFPITFEKVSY